MRYLSVCSGIEAATVAWHPLGWEPAGFSEIEQFPSAVLNHNYPKVTNYGDMTKYKEWKNVGRIDLLVGGTPCQSFSVAGLRGGLADPRGNLMLTYGAIADHFKPTWIVWENVPGVLSSNKGRDFGTFLGMLAELGYGFAYRVLDAQYYGVAQRRRRVFVVGYLGDWRRAAQVLFESESLCRHTPPSREKGQGFAQDVASCLRSRDYKGPATDNLHEGSNLIPSYGIPGNWIGRKPENGGNAVEPMHNVAPCLTGADKHGVASQSAVRRLTPIECERLQGFPDDYTRIPYRGKSPENCPDGPRYKVLGNSMAVPVMRWIGERIKENEQCNPDPTKPEQ